MANDIGFTLKVNGTERIVKSVAEIEQSIKDLTASAKKMDIGSAEFKQTQIEIDKTKVKLAELSKTSEKANSEFATSGNNLAEGLGNAQSALSEFGIANEKVIDGVKGGNIAIRAIAGATRSWTTIQKVLNVVMNANPVLLIVSGVLALSAAVVAIIKPLREFVLGLGFFNKVGEYAEIVINKIRDALSWLTGGLIDDTATKKTRDNADEILKAFEDISSASNKMIDQKKRELAEMEAAGAREEDLLAKKKEIIADEIAARQQVIDALQKEKDTTKDMSDEKIDMLNTLNKEVADLRSQDIVNQSSYNKKRYDKQKEANDKLIKEAEDLKVEQIKIIKETHTAIRSLLAQQQVEAVEDADKKAQYALDAAQKAAVIAKEEQISTLKLKKNKTQEEINLMATLYYELEELATLHGLQMANLLDAQAQARIKAAEETAIAEKEAAMEQADNWMEFKIGLMGNQFDAERAAIEQNEEYANRYNDEQLKKNLISEQEHADAKVAIAKQAANAKMQVAVAEANFILNVAASALGSFAELSKKGSKTWKTLKIAEATINMISGAVSALTGMISTIPGPVGIILGAVAAAGVVATGIINIDKIKKTKMGDDVAGSTSAPPVPQPSKFARGGIVSGAGGSTSDSVSAMLSPGESVINANSTSMFKDTLSSINQAGGGSGFGSSSSQPILKTYVVSSDMTNQQEADKKISDLARL